MTKTPYIGYSSDTLKKQPVVSVGTPIECPNCGGIHDLEGDDNGSTVLLIFRCSGSVYLGAVHGRAIVGVKSDFSGETETKEGS